MATADRVTSAMVLTTAKMDSYASQTLTMLPEASVPTTGVMPPGMSIGKMSSACRTARAGLIVAVMLVLGMNSSCPTSCAVIPTLVISLVDTASVFLTGVISTAPTQNSALDQTSVGRALSTEVIVGSVRRQLNKYRGLL